MKLMMSDRGLIARAMRRTAHEGHDPYNSHDKHAVSFVTEKRNEWKRKRQQEVKFSQRLEQDATAEIGWWKGGNK